MRAADDEDFTAFVAAASRRLLRSAYLITGNTDEAQDLLQVALERTYRHWPSVRRRDAPEAYARRVLVNAATDAWRRSGNRHVALDEAQMPALEDPDLAGIPSREALLSHGRPPPVTIHHRAGRQFVTSAGGDAIAADSRMIYVATGDHPGAALNAYSQATGRLVRRVGIPAMPSALRIGPDGSVWVAFYPDQNGGGTGVWRLSPDLAMRSGINLGTRQYFGAAPFDVLVTSADTAVRGTDHGIGVLRLPVPGQSGRATVRWRRFTPAVRQGFPTELFPLAGRVAVGWVTDDGRHAISIPGRARPVYRARVSSIAAESNGLWLTTVQLNDTSAGHLIRLDAELRLVTPPAITENRVLAHAERVWAEGTTVWVLTAGSRSVSCFGYHGGHVGAVGVVRTRLPVSDLAASPGTVYVLNSIGVVGYAIPAACR